METELLTLFGVSVEQIALVSGVVLLAVEYLKREFKGTAWEITEWKTKVIAFAVAFGISAKLLYPDWGAIITLAIASFILPSGLKSLVKKGRTK